MVSRVLIWDKKWSISPKTLVNLIWSSQSMVSLVMVGYNTPIKSHQNERDSKVVHV